MGRSGVEYLGTDAEASLTSGRRPSGVGGYTCLHSFVHAYMHTCRHTHTHTDLCKKHIHTLVHTRAEANLTLRCASMCSNGLWCCGGLPSRESIPSEAREIRLSAARHSWRLRDVCTFGRTQRFATFRVGECEGLA